MKINILIGAAIRRMLVGRRPLISSGHKLSRSHRRPRRQRSSARAVQSERAPYRTSRNEDDFIKKTNVYIILLTFSSK
jgi:hypothetical protein